MNEFGTRFGVNDPSRFESLRSLFAEITRDKKAGRFRDPANWARLVPDEVKSRFSWPNQEDMARSLAVRDCTAIFIPEPSQQIGARWDFYRVFEAIEDSDYDLRECEMVGEGVAEMRIEPHAYPYGGIGPLIALVEAFGFTVLGVNEFGRYVGRSELLGGGDS
jgi:hypothetical protein